VLLSVLALLLRRRAARALIRDRDDRVIKSSNQIAKALGTGH
jgi:predicted methyltransferase